MKSKNCNYLRISSLLIFFLFSIYSLNGLSQVKKSISAGASLSTGNLNLLNSNLQFSVYKDTGSVMFNINPSILVTLNKVQNKYNFLERESFITTSLSKSIGKIKIIGNLDAENSYLRKTIFRITGGFGVGYTVVDREKYKLSISEVLMPEYFMSENMQNKYSFSLRPSTRIKFKYSGKFNFETVNYFQPSVWTSEKIPFKDNINFRSTTSIDFPISKYISIGAQVIVQVFTLPSYFDDKIKPTDTNFLFTVKAKF